MIVDYFHIIRITIPEPKDDAPVCGHLDHGEAPAVAGQPVDADPLGAQVLRGGAAVQKLEQEVDLLGELGGEPPSVASGESLRGAIAEGADPTLPA